MHMMAHYCYMKKILFSQPGSKQKMTKNVGFGTVLHFQCTQFCSLICKDHPDVYYFFIEGEQQKLSML